jgi:predicted helicase
VPTVDLLAQTVHAYREVYGDAALGPIVAVCSDQNVTRRHEIDLRAEHADVTTSPDELNQLTSGHRCTVFTTYASLTVIAEAHRGHGAAPWDLAVVDEAHRTAGEQGRPWSAIHDDRQIPAHAGYI